MATPLQEDEALTRVHQRFLRLDEVKHITGLSRSAIYRLLSESDFPRPIRIVGRSVGWLDTEIVAWVDRRINESRQPKLTTTKKDRLRMATPIATPFKPPTREQVIKALTTLWPGFGDFYKAPNRSVAAKVAMLKHHYHAPNETTTATALGLSAGYTDYPAQCANLFYGALGHEIGDAIVGFTFDRFEKTGEPIYTSAIGNIVSNTSLEPGDWMIVMHDSVREALDELTTWGWSNAIIAEEIVGSTIMAVKLHSETYDPIITLDDGSTLWFEVDTERAINMRHDLWDKKKEEVK